MLLSSICVNPDRFQLRDAAYSSRTVDSIVAEGIVPAKFDPLPLIQIEAGLYCVAGDGHSRFEAINRLAAKNLLPAEWLIDEVSGEYAIPHRLVDEREARRLAFTSNLSRDNFNAAEEAKVFKAMVDDGYSLEEVAAAAHKSIQYVRRMLPLNDLCRDIRDALAAPDTEGGIDKHIAQAMAERFARYGIGHQVQQRLWHDLFKQISLTPKLVRETLDRVGPKLGGVQSTADGALFALPPAVAAVVGDMKNRADDLRRATRGLAWLVQCVDSGILDDLAGLGDWVRHHGRASLDQLKERYAADADVIGQLIA